MLQAVQGEAVECCWCLTFLPPSLFSLSLYLYLSPSLTHFVHEDFLVLPLSILHLSFFPLMLNFQIVGALCRSVAHRKQLWSRACDACEGKVVFHMTGWHVRRCCLPWWREGVLRFTHASKSTCNLQLIIYCGCFTISYIWKLFANKTCENVCILLCRPFFNKYCKELAVLCCDKYSCTSCSFFTIKACQMFAGWKLLMWGSISSILTLTAAICWT